MSTASQKQNLIAAVMQIRAAEQLLLDVSRSSSNTAQLIRINTEYTHLDSYLSQILHAQALTDDAEFASATTMLKGQASVLEVDQKAIDKVVGDVATAGKIVGYIAQAVQIIAKL